MHISVQFYYTGPEVQGFEFFRLALFLSNDMSFISGPG